MDKYADLVRRMSEASLTLVRELNAMLLGAEARTHSDYRKYRELSANYDTLSERYEQLLKEHEELLEEHEELDHNYRLVLDEVDDLTEILKKYEKEDT